MNPCKTCLCAYCCRLALPTISECPIFISPPHEPPTNTQLVFDKILDEHLESLVKDDFPLHWSSEEGCEMGGDTE